MRSSLLLCLLTLAGPTLSAEEAFKCEEISIAMCRNIGYNVTSMPNRFHQDTQEEAGLEVHQYWPLVEIHCSEDLQFFLCATYVPICLQEYGRTLPVCRAVCERARLGCEPVMMNHNFAWPERLDCKKLPEYGDPENLCMDNKNGEGRVPPRRRPPPPPRCSCQCREPRAIPLRPAHHLYNHSVQVGGLADCAMPCRSPYFSTSQYQFADRWIQSWAILCAVSTFLTVTTFLIDRSRFQYPERPIIFLAACYFMVSAGYIIRLGAGHELTACDGAVIRYDSYVEPGNATGAAVCTVVFLLIYFFGMASSVWWVVLSLTWFLAAGLKWGNEVIAGYSQYFHLAAWVIPAVKSIVVLSTAAVDGDSLAGICSVGNQSLTNLRGFVLIPLVAYLLLGTSFLLAGFISLFRIRQVMKQDRSNKDKLEKLMIRIGVFSVLYTVPASVVIACLFYEQHLRPSWERTLVCPCPESDELAATPNFNLFLLRYFMSLAVGVTSIIWVWSRKTLQAWCVLLGCRKPQPQPAALGRRYEVPALQVGKQTAGGSGLPGAACPGTLMQSNMNFSHTTSHTLSDPNQAASHKSLPLSHV